MKDWMMDDGRIIRKIERWLMILTVRSVLLRDSLVWFVRLQAEIQIRLYAAYEVSPCGRRQMEDRHRRKGRTGES